MKSKYNRTWLCELCNVIFTVHVAMPRRTRIFCPQCGENTDTVSYTAERTDPDSEKKLRWKPHEISVMQEVLDGKKFPIQAALELGRTPNSVAKKLARMRKETV